MVRIKIKGKLDSLRKYRKRNLPPREAYNKGFKKVENPEELYVDKLEPFPSVYTRHQYGVYLRGDGSTRGSDLRIKEFPTAYEANQFLNELKESPLLEKIKIKVFSHTDDSIYYTPDDFITSEYYYEIYPQLKKYQHKRIENQNEEWFVFLKTLGLKEQDSNEECECCN